MTTAKNIAADPQTRPVLPFSPSEDGWYPVLPIGVTHRTRLYIDDTLREIEELFDDASAQAVLDAFRAESARPHFPGVLVDLEHHSRDPEQRSEAAAWIDDMEIRPGALYAHLRLTDLGDSLIRGGRYRMLSPVVALHRLGKLRFRPVKLLSVGLTNVPDLRHHLPPLSHRAPDGASTPTPTTPPEDSQMEAILAALGLASDASTDDALAALAALNQSLTAAQHTATEAEQAKVEAEHRATQAETRVTTLETAQREREADALIAEHRDRLADPDAVRKRYLADPDGTRELIAALRPTATPEGDATGAEQIKLHRADTRAPSDPAARAQERDTLLGEVVALHRCTHAQAWDIARKRRPDLF